MNNHEKPKHCTYKEALGECSRPGGCICKEVGPTPDQLIMADLPSQPAVLGKDHPAIKLLVKIYETEALRYTNANLDMDIFVYLKSIGTLS